MGLDQRPIARRVATAHKANPQICPRRRKNEVCMCKTFALQVWQTTRLTHPCGRSNASRNLHSDNLTASQDSHTADDALFSRHRLQGPGHPSPTASPNQTNTVIRSGECAAPLCAPARAWRQPVGTRASNAPIGGTARPACPRKRRRMHQKHPAQTVKCVKFYTNASFLYVRSTL